MGECYANLGLYNLAIEKHKKSIRVVENVGDDLIDYRKAVNFLDIAVDLKLQKKPLDSNYYYLSKAFYYIKKSPEHLKKYTKETKNGVTAVVTANIGEHWESRKNLDSANQYYLKSLDLIEGTNNKIIEGNVLTMVGNFFLRQKQYHKAIGYFEKCIEISKSTNDLYKLRDSYKGISEAYKNLGNEIQFAKYSQDYIKIDDSIAASEKKGIDNSVNKIINEEKTVQEKSKSKLYWLIFGILVAAVLMLIAAYFFHQKMKKTKENIISNSEERLAKKREIIEQKEQETKELKQKVNESFEEIIHLAKTNSPEFFSRFQEIYPEFRNKLLQINPDLKTSELTLCAYILLGFNTKDIAEYTFKAEKTVRNNKYNVRKRLDVPAKSDFTVWLRNYIEN